MLAPSAEPMKPSAEPMKPDAAAPVPTLEYERGFWTVAVEAAEGPVAETPTEAVPTLSDAVVDVATVAADVVTGTDGPDTATVATDVVTPALVLETVTGTVAAVPVVAVVVVGDVTVAVGDVTVVVGVVTVTVGDVTVVVGVVTVAVGDVTVVVGVVTVTVGDVTVVVGVVTVGTVGTVTACVVTGVESVTVGSPNPRSWLPASTFAPKKPATARQTSPTKPRRVTKPSRPHPPLVAPPQWARTLPFHPDTCSFGQLPKRRNPPRAGKNYVLVAGFRLKSSASRRSARPGGTRAHASFRQTKRPAFRFFHAWGGLMTKEGGLLLKVNSL
jgi:hypothetical protein